MQYLLESLQGMAEVLLMGLCRTVLVGKSNTTLTQLVSTEIDTQNKTKSMYSPCVQVLRQRSILLNNNQIE